MVAGLQSVRETRETINDGKLESKVRREAKGSTKKTTSDESMQAKGG